MWRVVSLPVSSVLIIGVLNYLLITVASSDIQSVMTNKEVEFKTEAPKDISNVKKDCYEYLHGHLSEIRHHGTTWQNGVSDCSNCTCDDGDIRCFFHFCKGPSTGYMTPPSADLGNLQSEDDSLLEESSGFPPPGIGADDYGTFDDEDTGTKAISESTGNEINRFGSSDDYFVLSNDIITELPQVETNEIIIDDDRMKETKIGKWPPKIVPELWQKGGLSVQETSSTMKEALNEVFHFINKPKNLSENETHHVFPQLFCDKVCKKICRRGFVVDPKTGCLKCKCSKCHLSCANKCPSGYVSDENGCNTCACITSSFTTDEDITFKEDPVLNEIHNMPSSSAGENNNRVLEKKVKFFEPAYQVTVTEKKQNDSPVTHKEEETTKTVGIIRDMFQITKEKVEEPYNTTDPADLRDIGSTNGGNSLGELYLGTRNEENILVNEPFFDMENDDEATIKSLAKDDHFTLLAILLPMGIVCGLIMFLLMHVWRKYHSDKYDINAYRPDEKQKLRPVKTLHDDQCSLKHV